MARIMQCNAQKKKPNNERNVMKITT